MSRAVNVCLALVLLVLAAVGLRAADSPQLERAYTQGAGQ